MLARHLRRSGSLTSARASFFVMNNKCSSSSSIYNRVSYIGNKAGDVTKKKGWILPLQYIHVHIMRFIHSSIVEEGTATILPSRHDHIIHMGTRGAERGEEHNNKKRDDDII